MSNNATNVRPVFRDSVGNPRANGWVYFFNNKTTELADIFSDELLSVAQANPYQLNAYGAIDGDVKYTGKLTVTHTNEDGSDPISDDDVESLGGATSDAYVDQFKVIENDPANMAVIVTAGKVMNGETLVSIANQTTTLITAPVSNPRIDRIVVDKLTGVYTIVAGSESATPVAPAIPVGKMPAAQISLQTSTSTIVESLITDERVSGSVEPSNINTTETLSNKTIGDTNTINAQDDAFTIDDAADATLQVDFNVAGTTGTKTTIASSQTANRTLTLPDVTDTLVARTTTDTLTNKTIGDTNTINAQDDAFTIDDASDATIQIDFNAAGTTSTKTTITGSQTANRVLTLPDATDTLVGKNTTDVLANKTLTSPIVSGAAPSLRIIETGVTADNGTWRVLADAERLVVQVGNDAEDTWVDVFDIERTGTTVDELNVINGVLKVAGVTVNAAPPAVSGYAGSEFSYTEDDAGISSSSLLINTAVTASTWESVGPTGSGATNIYAALDIVPATASVVKLRVLSRAEGQDAGQLSASFQVSARKTGSSRAAGSGSSEVFRGYDRKPALNDYLTMHGANGFEVPVDSNGRFDIYWAMTSLSTSIQTCYLNLAGWSE